MSRNWFLLLNILGAFLLAIGLLLGSSSPVQAQCGDNPPKSSCITCHAKEDPVYKNGEWHGIHALKDCCTNCHGGNCSAQEKALAHESLVAHPLDDIYTNCHSCHPDDYTARAERFAALLGVTPGSSPTATPAPAVPVEEHAIVILPLSSSSAPAPLPWMLALGGMGFTILFLLGLLGLANHLRSQA